MRLGRRLEKSERIANGRIVIMKRLSVILALTAIVVSISAAAVRYELQTRTAESLPELIDLAPPNSTFVLYADVAALRQAPLVQKAIASAQPPAPDRDYQEFAQSTGFDYERDVDHVMIAGSTDGTAARTMAVAEGRFDQKKIAEYALRTGKVENRNGGPVYVIPSVTPAKTISFSFLSASRIAVSDSGDFPSMRSASSGQPLDGAMRERLSRVAGAPLFLAAKTPTSSLSVPSNSPAAVASSLFQSIRWLDFAAQPDGDNVILSAEAECAGPEDAQRVATALELLRTVLSGAANPKGATQASVASAAAMQQLLKGASVATTAERVRLLITVTPDMIKLASSASATAPASR
jgi:hypothetical protein